MISEPREDVKRLMERMLLRLGHEPIATTVPDAEQLAGADALIVEPLDPVGAVLAQAASMARPSLPLICASVAQPGPEFVELGVAFSACLIKPFTTGQLEVVLERALTASRRSRGDYLTVDRPPTPYELTSRPRLREAPPLSASETTPIGTPLAEASGTPPAVRRRVLLVDGDPDVRTAACASLEQAGGWLVIPAESGEAALDSLPRSGPLDAVLLDVSMPGLGRSRDARGLA
ncbi:MAG TPA: hypothetical protein VIJ50_10880 [Solirubrobacteraceae bacterium]